MPGQTDKQTDPNGNETTPGGQDQQVTFEGWLGEQPEEVRGLIDGHIAGLKSALQDEREQRKALAKQLREATKKLEEGSEAREALEGLTANLEDASRRAEFYETVGNAGVTNLKLAWIVAREANLIDGQGNVNLSALKEQFPELFKPSTPPKGNAGSGVGQEGTPTKGMNSFIRRAAGRE
jgi:hypothetical protein